MNSKGDFGVSKLWDGFRIGLRAPVLGGEGVRTRESEISGSESEPSCTDHFGSRFTIVYLCRRDGVLHPSRPLPYYLVLDHPTRRVVRARPAAGTGA